MTLFEQFGIQEVADFTIYSIHKKNDGSGDVYYMPALYLDTLKVSTVEKTSENTWAQGGQGNARLINWDYNKEINVSLEDALCTPASLGLCWGGVLSADWENNQVNINSDACFCQNPLTRISRMEKAFYPRNGNEPEDHVISNLLPQTGNEGMIMDLLKRSEVVDGTKIQGTGVCYNHNYRWRLIVESGVRSVAQVPDRFFDIEGRSYPIDWNSKVSVFNGEAPTYSNFKDAIIYRIGNPTDEISAKPYIIFDAWMDNYEKNDSEEDEATLSLQKYLTEYQENLSANVKVDDENNDTFNYPPSDVAEIALPLTQAKFLAIVVDNNNVYHAYVAKEASEADINSSEDGHIQWYTPEKAVNVSQFKGLDMWIRFESINAMIYFMLTKYERDIQSIIPAFRTQPVNEDGSDPDAVVNKDKTILKEYDQNTEENEKTEGKLWAYVNPRTMKPYDDDYWFHEGEPYFVKSLTIQPRDKSISGNKIYVKAGEFPGMYMCVGETWIRDRDTGKDHRMQLKFPLCRVSSEQTITLEAGGDATVFDLNLEIAQPADGVMMEITAYEVSKKMIRGENGCYYAVDGSSEVVTE